MIEIDNLISAYLLIFFTAPVTVNLSPCRASKEFCRREGSLFTSADNGKLGRAEHGASWQMFADAFSWHLALWWSIVQCLVCFGSGYKKTSLMRRYVLIHNITEIHTLTYSCDCTCVCMHQQRLMHTLDPGPVSFVNISLTQICTCVQKKNVPKIMTSLLQKIMIRGWFLNTLTCIRLFTYRVSLKNKIPNLNKFNY